MQTPKELRNRVKHLETRLSVAVDKQLVLLNKLIELQERYDQLLQEKSK